MVAMVLLVLSFWALLGYVFGSFPTGVILARIMGLGNLRSIGSGNIGATNVLRTGSKTAAIGTLIGDAAKGAIIVIIAYRIHGDIAAQAAALGAFIGHCYPLWLHFKGGKGVATFLGVVLALNWPVGLAACAVWALAAWRMRISSLSALVAAAVVPAFTVTSFEPQQTVLMIALAVLVFWRHRDNIARLQTGDEPRIGQS